MRRCELMIPAKTRKSDRKQREKVIKLLLEGKSLEEVVKETGASFYNVHRIRWEYNFWEGFFRKNKHLICGE